MHVQKIVAQILKPCLQGLHAKRIGAMQRTVGALLTGGILSLSALALSLKTSARYKHRLKSVDRLLGNKALHSSRVGLYAELARRWLSGIKQVLVVVDWSDLTADQRWHLLRASVVVEGRSLRIVERTGGRDVRNRDGDVIEQVHGFERFIASARRSRGVKQRA